MVTHKRYKVGNRKIISLYLIFFIFSLNRCIVKECYPKIKGIVLDELTRKPIKDVKIKFGASQATTNSEGKFDIFCSTCDQAIIVSKDGYKTFKSIITKNNDKLLFEIDNEIKYIELKAPKYLDSGRSSFVISEPHSVNSIHFEYTGQNTDSIVIYLANQKITSTVSDSSRVK